MRGVGLGLLAACLFAGQAASEESASEAIRAFGLVGTWSTDCSKTPIAACNTKDGCGSRTTYEAPASRPPIIWNVAGTPTTGQGRVFETTIDSAIRIGDDKIKLITTQQQPSGVTLVWWRQPGERWEVVLIKVGNKYRTYSAQREDGMKVAAKEGFIVMPPSDTKYNEMPTTWVRGDKETPSLEKCTN
jgi:hypothetical protein